MVLVIFAHPYENRSRANRVLLERVKALPGVEVRALYDLYPGFDIDVEAEQEELLRARALVWQHPFYWYSVPALLKHWFDKVLARGFAYGKGGRALHGKCCLWVTTTGGDEHAFSKQGMHGFEFSAFRPAVEQTARFCGMRWLAPLAIHAAHQITDEALDAAAARYEERVRALAEAGGVS